MQYVGLRRRKNKEVKGHLLDTADGRWAREADLSKNDESAPDEVHGDRVQRVVPYVEDHRNALLIHLDPAIPDEQRMAAMYALNGAWRPCSSWKATNSPSNPCPVAAVRWLGRGC